MRENKTCPNLGWQQLPTEELDRILQAELEKEYPDEEVVLPILQELGEREKNDPVEMTPEDLEILEKLSEYHTSTKQSIQKRRWIAAIAAVAAVVCLVVLAMPRTVGADSFFNVLFRWTSSVFEFFTPEQDASNPPVDAVFETDNPGLQQLYEKVTELGATEAVVPTWLPEEFDLSELKELQISDGNKVYGRFENGNNMIVLTYQILGDLSGKVEKEDSSVEVYECADIRHIILENEDLYSVTWTVDGVDCLMNADVSKDELYTIIKSIYRRPLE